MTAKNGVIAAIIVAFALGGNTWLALRAHGDLGTLVHEESVQRVHTIGERCEATDHQAKVLHHNLPPSHVGEAAWFDKSYRRCLGSLAKVEARAGVHYRP